LFSLRAQLPQGSGSFIAFAVRVGYSFPASVESRTQGITIAYFVANPTYPWWYVDVFGLKNAEVISLDEQYAVFAHPGSWLTAQRLAF